MKNKKGIPLILAADHLPGLLRKLKRIKIMPGDRIAVMADNCPHFAILAKACWEIGAVLVPVSIQFPSGKIHLILESLNCSRIIVGKNINYSDTPGIKSYNLKDLLTLKETRQCILKMGTINWLGNSQPSDIMLSSGTSSGQPKAILHTLDNHYYNALGSQENIDFSPEHIWLANLPIHHISGFSLIMRSLLKGGGIGFAPKEMSIGETISGIGISHLSVVPSILHEYLKEKNSISSLTTLRALLVGGGPSSSKLMEEAVFLRLPVLSSYGSTEMASQITTTCPGDSLPHLKTSGRILKYREIKISYDREIMVKGRTLFRGYIANEKLISPFDSSGWFKTGDLGYLDDDGYLSLLGRKDSMFISGGENIYPEEIEKELTQLPEIIDALVVPVAHPKFGEIPVAFIKTQKGRIPGIKIMHKFLSKNIEKYKIPKYYFPWPEKDLRGIKSSRNKFKEIALKQLKKIPQT